MQRAKSMKNGTQNAKFFRVGFCSKTDDFFSQKNERKFLAVFGRNLGSKIEKSSIKNCKKVPIKSLQKVQKNGRVIVVKICQIV